jgi:hypothetical protein
MQAFDRLGDRALAGLRRLRSGIEEGDARVSVIAGAAADQGLRAGIERNLERLMNGSEQDVMQRLIAEHEVKPGSAQEADLRARIKFGGEQREPLARYAEKLNRGPGGLTKRGLGEAAAETFSKYPAARVAGLYAPAAALGVAGLTAVGQGLLGLIARREEAVATLAELDRMAAMAREGEGPAAVQMGTGTGG